MARIASMSVYDRETGREIAKGETVRTADGNEYRMVAAISPTVPGKSGRVLVKVDSTHPHAVTRYAHIFGVIVKGWMDCGCPVGPDAGGHLDTCKEGVESCTRCGRPWHPWPLVRPPVCSPKGWAHCIRPKD